MIAGLKDHPFAVDAFFKHSYVLAFAAPMENLQHLIPESLTLDVFNDRWGFVAMALVETKNLRPTGFPEFLGKDFFLIGYRVFVRYATSKGKRLRGLYIIRSETDKSQMAFFGNIFTHYQYSQTDIRVQAVENGKLITSAKSDFRLHIEVPASDIALPSGSTFPSWKEARRFAGPLPFTFTYDSDRKEMLIIEGVRNHWEPKPLLVHDFHSRFLTQLNIPDLVLANAFSVQDIPYRWRKGIKDKWQNEEPSRAYSIS